MKALSLGLVKGTVDEVEQRIHLTWVQPRVLDIDQVGLALTGEGNFILINIRHTGILIHYTNLFCFVYQEFRYWSTWNDIRETLGIEFPLFHITVWFTSSGPWLTRQHV